MKSTKPLFCHPLIKQYLKLQAGDKQASSRYSLQYLHIGSLRLIYSRDNRIEYFASMPSLEGDCIGISHLMGIRRSEQTYLTH